MATVLDLADRLDHWRYCTYSYGFCLAYIWGTPEALALALNGIPFLKRKEII